ncbi:hypothetical protein Tco_0790567 [Tanacetum coccineum]
MGRRGGGKGMRSIISMVSISLEGFLPSILLLVLVASIVASKYYPATVVDGKPEFLKDWFYFPVVCDPTDEDGDIGMGDSTGVSASLGGEIFSGGKKCERASEAKRSLVKSSEKLGEVFPGEAGK